MQRMLRNKRLSVLAASGRKDFPQSAGNPVINIPVKSGNTVGMNS